MISAQTEMQMTWAKDIKSRAIPKIRAEIAHIKETAATQLAADASLQPKYDRTLDAIERWREWINSRDAQWWIDNRGLSGDQYLRKAQQAVKA